MAASMRNCVKVKGKFLNNIRPISLRLVLLKHWNACRESTSYHIRGFSAGTSKSLDESDNNDSDDFFGIPADFKLQHARHSSSGTVQKSESLYPETHSIPQNGQESSISKQHLSPPSVFPESDGAVGPRSLKRRERRQQRIATNLETTFGAISFDEQSVKDLKLNENDLLNRAERLFRPKQPQGNVKQQQSDFTDIKSGSRSSHRHVSTVQQKCEVESETEKGSRTYGFAKTETQSSSSSNFFDEFYFPELSSVEGKVEAKDSFSGMDLNSDSHVSSSSIKTSQQKSLQKERRDQAYDDTGIQQDSSTQKKSASVSSNIFDEQYFSAAVDNDDALHHSDSKPFISEEPYFSNSRSAGKPSTINSSVPSESLHNLNEVDEQYFGNYAKQKDFNVDSDISSQDMHQGGQQISSFSNVVSKHTPTESVEMDKTSFSSTDSSSIPKRLGHHKSKSQDNTRNQSEPGSESDEHVISSEQFLRQQAQMRPKRKQPNMDNPEIAYDFAMKIRHELKHGSETAQTSDYDHTHRKDLPEKEDTGEHVNSRRKLDDKGFRVLDDQVPNYELVTSADMARKLKQRIIFNHDDFLAIDKPYGLPTVGQAKDRLSISQLLPSLVRLLPPSYNVEDLHIVQGLDRDVTGTIILAKNPEVASILRGMYNNHDEVIQRFWAITKGVPNPPAGIIDIPIGEDKVGNIYKMVLRPRFYKEQRLVGKPSSASSVKAVTEYKVLNSHLQSALVECTLHSNHVKHQLRVHLASGLNTPILGDHKYSHFDKAAPQKLHKDMLELLKIRQSKVRTLALHLHCRTVVLTNYKGRTIVLTTRAPIHFKDNAISLNVFLQTKSS